QLPHTIANKLSNNSRHSTQENTIQTNETTDTVVPDTTGQVLQSSPIANQLSNNSRQSTQENTIQTNETTDTVVPDTTGQVLQSSPIANQLSNNSRQSTQENTIQTNETTEEQPSASSMTTRSQMRYLAFAKQFQSGDTENTEENTTIPERVRRQYAKKRLQLLEKLKNQWGIQDDTDYSEVFQSVMDSLQPVENEVKDPGVLVDLFVQYLPVTANLIALQAIDQFIRLFPKNMQTYLRNVKIAEYVSIYPNTYNYLEELDEYGQRSFYVYFFTKPGQSKRLYCIQPLPEFQDNFHVISTIALDTPERVPYGGKVVFQASRKLPKDIL
ncbi:hypothetical protein TVAG_541870, partial [Trichomonas vaginalis G3]